jgi:hypothetical protein
MFANGDLLFGHDLVDAVEAVRDAFSPGKGRSFCMQHHDILCASSRRRAIGLIAMVAELLYAAP